MATNSRILRIARVAKQLTQKELAERLGVSQGKIAKWEDGLLTPSDAEIDKLGESLECATALFESGDEWQFATCCLYHRKRVALPATLLSTIHARVNLAGIGIGRMLQNVAMTSAIEYPTLDVDEYDGAQRVSQLLRTAWGIPPGPISSLVHFIEAAGGIVVPMDFETNLLDAVSLRPRGLRPLFFINSQSPTDRCRFTLAHELGHIVMHTIPSPNAEAEADEFASEFLMPASDISSDPDFAKFSLAKAARMKVRWRTSMQSLIMKAKSVGAITPRQHRSLFTQLSAAGYRKREPVRLEPEHPQTLGRLISVHRNDLGYSEADMAALTFCVSEEQFRSRFRGVTEHGLRVVG